MSFRIMHLATDDKFIPLQQDLFESALPGSNRFRILTKGGADFTFPGKTSSTIAVSREFFSSDAARADLAESDCIICHSLTDAFVEAIRLVPDATLVVWSAWGFEYYRLVEERYGSALMDSTHRLWQRMKWRNRMRTAVRPSGLRVLVGNLGRKMRRAPSADTALVAVAKRLDVVSINPSDFPRVRAVLPDLNAVNHLLPYITTEDTLEQGPPIMHGPDILLGNSATLTNNHLEAFDELRKIDLTGRRIIAPLSYGDTKYADHVSREGTKMFGGSFVPLRRFLSLEEYSNKIARCGTVVMNHVRQQAVGNISAALYKRARVYLREETPLFEFFRGLGAHVYRMAELREQGREGTGEDESAMGENRRVIGEFWARERAISQIRLLPGIRKEMCLAKGFTEGAGDRREPPTSSRVDGSQEW